MYRPISSHVLVSQIMICNFDDILIIESSPIRQEYFSTCYTGIECVNLTQGRRLKPLPQLHHKLNFEEIARKFVPLTLIFIVFLNQTLPRLLDAPSLENVHAKRVSCGARHTAVITGMHL